MTIYKVIRRYTYGKKPHEVQDTESGLFKTLEGAERYVKSILYKGYKADDEFWDVWKSDNLPKIEYHILPTVVHD